MMAHGIHEKFSHEPAIGAVRIAFDSNCVGLHFGDNEMRTAVPSACSTAADKRFFVSNGCGVGDARALGDFF